MKTDMKGVFFIVKGQYRRRGEVFYNDVSGEKNYLGGYDPESEDTVEWYMLLDNITFNTWASGCDLNKILLCARKYIKKYVSRDRFLASLDTMEGGKNTSPIHARLMREVYNTYGDYYEDKIEKVVGDEYEVLKDTLINPYFKKTKRLFKRVKNTSVETPRTPVETPQDTLVSTPKMLGKVRKRIKLLSV